MSLAKASLANTMGIFESDVTVFWKKKMLVKTSDLSELPQHKNADDVKKCKAE